MQTSSLQVHDSILSRHTRGPLLALLGGLLIPLALALVALVAFELANGGRIYPGVRIAGVDVGRARTADALSRLARAQLGTSALVVGAGGRTWTIRQASLGVRYDLASQVHTAYLLGRSGPLLDRLRTQATLIVRTQNLPPVVRYDRTRLAAVVATLGRQIDRPVVDAAVALRHGRLSLWRPAAAGRRLDQKAAMTLLAAALAHPGRTTVILPVGAVPPRLTTAAALDRAVQTTRALAAARRLRAGLAGHAQIAAHRAARREEARARRRAHLHLLAVGQRALLAQAAASLARQAHRLTAVSMGGHLYRVPPAMAQALLRIVPAGATPRVAVSPAGVERYVAVLAARVSRRPRPALLLLAQGRPVLVPSIVGEQVDTRAAARALTDALLARGGAVTPALPVRYQHPNVETAMLEPALAQARWLLAHPPTLTYGGIRWTPAPGALAAAVRLPAPGQGTPRGLDLDPKALRHVAAWLAGKVARAAQNATFAVDGQTARVVPSADGQALDERALARRLLRAAPGTAALPVPVRPVVPGLTTARARALGIRTMVGMSYTNFYGSTGNRITNILAAVGVLDGSLIAPGAVFSFNTAIGTIDYAHGYVDGISIIDGKDVPGVGGGVCQVAVTIFKGALYTGLPIVERIPHDNVVSYYQPVGMDATIYDAPGGPDVKFKNNTGHWLLMKFAYDLNTAYLEVRFYGTNIDQTTEIDGPYYTYPGNGDTTAIFYRKVYRRGKKIIDENFFSHYVPAQ